MNKAKLKSYAPQARKDFIAAVTARANLLGLSEKAGKLEVAVSQPHGDVTVIAGQAWPVKVHSQREQLIARIRKDGFAHAMEAVAYTWFNRFAALRYMELHDYLSHGHRALSSQEGTLPDILTHAADLAKSGELPGLKPALVAEMKLAGNRDSELYRLLLVAQCNTLSNAMPFLFERIDDETELLLPDNLLRTDSVIAKLVGSIAEDDWKEVEIIGWLYQFYISDKKDEVIGKVVKSEDIPAATQLFTPNWIVQYLVQNSIGRLWLMANPTSTLKAQWPFYIEPASQTAEVQAQLDTLIQTRINEDGGSLNPESITLLDPACGSGHILVEAYDVLRAIYLERGYQPRTIPRLILEKNLYGLDIDDRAAQMAGFALLMKARADDRRLFNEPINLNVLSLQESKGMDAGELTLAFQEAAQWDRQQIAVNAPASGFAVDDLGLDSRLQSNSRLTTATDRVSDSARLTIASLLATFADAKTFGSLIHIPQMLNVQLGEMAKRLQLALHNGDLYDKASAQDLIPLVAQSQVLGMQFDAVVANPPYMGSKGMNPALKQYAKATFPDSKSDLFAMFMERGFSWCKPTGFNSMVTMQSWMFLSSYESMRTATLNKRTIQSLIQIGYNSFPELNSKIALACAFSVISSRVRQFKGRYINLNSGSQSADKEEIFINRTREITYDLDQGDLEKLPGWPLAYWLSDKTRAIFSGEKIGSYLKSDGQILTGNNEKYLRQFWEVDCSKIGANLDWKLHHKGGDFRRWYGNIDWVVAWGNEAKNFYRTDKTARIPKEELWNLEGVTWSTVSSSLPSFRKVKLHESFNKAAPTIISKNSNDINFGLAILNSKVSSKLLNAINPTLNYLVEDVENLPYLSTNINKKEILKNVDSCISIAEADWNCSETSLEFSKFRLFRESGEKRLSLLFEKWENSCRINILNMQKLEEANNRIFLNAYNLEDEISPEVPESQITLARADREKDNQRLISYAIGCMMGRYSLDAPGLIYACAGNVGFDASQYATFSADTDGILPVTNELWFEDDATRRIPEFLLAVLGADNLAENMAWIAESLGSKANETPDETIRRYLADMFYKDHLQTYKKRPIYWLFSSGKQGAFQALVYLHRYHEGTLARMRAEYVVPLTGKIQSRIDMLQKDADTASSTAARNKLAKEIEKLKKKHIELLAYDEQLRHYADMRISLDLDDGVKVNYGKFGDLLADVKAVTGGASDD